MAFEYILNKAVLCFQIQRIILSEERMEPTNLHKPVLKTKDKK
jgi:hypothetical protein